MSEQKESPFEGLAIAAAFWLWGSLAWLVPIYIGFGGWEQWLFNIAGGILIAIAFMGALLELGKLWKSEALEYWGVGLLFLVPAALLHVAVVLVDLSSPLPEVAKSAALLLDAFGGTFMLLGLAHFFWDPPDLEEQPPELLPEEQAKESTAKRNRRKEAAASSGLFLLTVISTILKTLFF